MKEVCSCGAVFEYYRGEGLTDKRLERVYEMVKDWRASHKHDIHLASQNHDEPPFVDEAGSSHERAIGFAVAPEGGWI